MNKPKFQLLALGQENFIRDESRLHHYSFGKNNPCLNKWLLYVEHVLCILLPGGAPYSPFCGLICCSWSHLKMSWNPGDPLSRTCCLRLAWSPSHTRSDMRLGRWGTVHSHRDLCFLHIYQHLLKEQITSLLSSKSPDTFFFFCSITKPISLAWVSVH